MSQAGQYSGVAARINEAVDSICDTAKNVEQTAGRGYTAKFSDARLRQAVKDILPRLEQIDNAADEYSQRNQELDERARLLDLREVNITQREEELTEKEATVLQKQAEIVTSLSNLKTFRPEAAANQQTVADLQAQVRDLQAQLINRPAVPEVDAVLQGLGNIDFSLPTDPAIGQHERRARARRESRSPSLGRPQKRRSLGAPQGTPLLDSPLFGTPAANLALPSIESRLAMFENNAARQRISETPANELIHPTIEVPQTQSQGRRTISRVSRQPTQTYSVTDVLASIDLSGLNDAVQERVKGWFTTYAVKVKETEQASRVEASATGGDKECHQVRWTKNQAVNRTIFQSASECPNRKKVHDCIYLEHFVSAADDAIKYKAFLRRA